MKETLYDILCINVVFGEIPTRGKGPGRKPYRAPEKIDLQSQQQQAQASGSSKVSIPQAGSRPCVYFKEDFFRDDPGWVE